jgi:hypothetical protein
MSGAKSTIGTNAVERKDIPTVATTGATTTSSTGETVTASKKTTPF